MPLSLKDVARIQDSGLFDAAWYCARYPDVAASNIAALDHYLAFGADEGRSPGPRFNALWYLHRYSDVAKEHALLHYLEIGEEEGREPSPPGELYRISQKIVEQFSIIEPDLQSFADYRGFQNVGTTFISADSRQEKVLSAILDTLTALPKYVVFLPWLIHGGADLVACHAVRAMVEQSGDASVLVILTDSDRQEARHLLPANVLCLPLLQMDARLTADERCEVVEHIIRVMQPRAVLNVNSRACWDAMQHRGRVLRNFSHLYAMLFCPDFSVDGRRHGYGDTHFRGSIPWLEAVYFDNTRYIRDLQEQFAIPDTLSRRLVFLAQPSPRIAQNYRKPSSSRIKILWAGRITRQKNIGLLLQIASHLGELYELDIWGHAEAPWSNIMQKFAQSKANFNFRGEYVSFSQLPINEYEIGLYTSLWDGTPNVILELAASGLPIVASDVGGVGELVDEETGWIVKDLRDPKPYLRAIEQIRMQPAEAGQRVAKMRSRLADRHNWPAYTRTLSSEPRSGMPLLEMASG